MTASGSYKTGLYVEIVPSPTEIALPPKWLFMSSTDILDHEVSYIYGSKSHRTLLYLRTKVQLCLPWIFGMVRKQPRPAHLVTIMSVLDNKFGLFCWRFWISNGISDKQLLDAFWKKLDYTVACSVDNSWNTNIDVAMPACTLALDESAMLCNSSIPNVLHDCLFVFCMPAMVPQQTSCCSRAHRLILQWGLRPLIIYPDIFGVEQCAVRRLCSIGHGTLSINNQSWNRKLETSD